MFISSWVRVQTLLAVLGARLARHASAAARRGRGRGQTTAERALCGRARWRRSGGDRGQTTAEYALVIVGAAAVALLLLAWATGTGRISSLLDAVVDRVAGMLT